MGDSIERIPSSKYEFIELDRTFREISDDPAYLDEEFGTKYRYGKQFTWEDLVGKYRVIILSEAGSGKTEEIRNVTRRLRSEGKNAFFLRLENIPSGFEYSFEAGLGTYEEFQGWLKSAEEGWLLLDSVDEARLRHPSDFELAIRKIGLQLTKAKHRTHVIITGRSTAWRPTTDLACVQNHLPPPQNSKFSKLEDREPISTSDLETKDSGKKETFQIFAFDDLTTDQIAAFVERRGIVDTQKFLDDVERADAWSFTSRPQDLEELSAFWIDKQTIGNRLELLKSSIDRRLHEREQTRAELGALTKKRARRGAQILAATATLCKEPTIAVPDGASSCTGISVSEVLTDWSESDQQTLLARPIFDEAIYGTVRFHHRSVREYLTAEWFHELLKKTTSRRTIEALFFRNQYGEEFVTPSLRPVLPWLSIFDDRIRQRVQALAPEIFIEGGDPSQLPTQVRREILYDVCSEIASSNSGHFIGDNTAVRRFAHLDLVEDIRKLLRKYSGNDDLAYFLFEMVWLGELRDALPEVMSYASKPDGEKYARTMAFKALYAIGDEADKKRIRTVFLDEKSELNRDWLSNLANGLPTTDENLKWLLSSLEKVESGGEYSVDSLRAVVVEFVENITPPQLSEFISGLNPLLSRKPVIERGYCEISKRYKWLIENVESAVERLISCRHPNTLSPAVLDILLKISAFRDFGQSVGKSETDFPELISHWPELNRVLFWHSVERTRSSKEIGRITEFWQIPSIQNFWKFDASDFDYLCGEIESQSNLDNRLVALSLAFRVYVNSGRKRKWRESLKKIASIEAEIRSRLDGYLNPPAQDPKIRSAKQRQARWKKADRAREKKEEEHHLEWKNYLNQDENVKAISKMLDEWPKTIPNALWYLFNLTRGNASLAGRWTDYNWQSLISKTGQRIAEFYRDSVVSLWKKHEPLIRSEGAKPNSTPYIVVIGLTGLEIESIENPHWPECLTDEEVGLACRYASFELNGFPRWFPALFDSRTEIVGRFLIRELEYEVSRTPEAEEMSYLLNDLCLSGEWAWNWLAPKLLILARREPKTVESLRKLLQILQGSDLPDKSIASLASRKCRTVKNSEHLPIWFAVWVGTQPGQAIPALKKTLTRIPLPKAQTKFAITFITALMPNRYGDGVSAREGFRRPNELKALYLYMNEYIRPSDDISHSGVQWRSPGDRDDAQMARGALLEMLKEVPGKCSYTALLDLAKTHPEKAFRPWMLRCAEEKARRDGDIDGWIPSQVREFQTIYERTPRSHNELAELVHFRLLDLKDDVENGDTSVAKILLKADAEPDIRNYIANVLRERESGRYSLSQEDELADAKRPDLRFSGTEFDGPVPVELKLAEKNWSGNSLFERLENQLCGDYLRDNRSQKGFFVLVNRKENKRWRVPNRSKSVGFSQLVDALQDHWSQISSSFPNVESVEVIGIDLTKRFT